MDKFDAIKTWVILMLIAAAASSMRLADVIRDPVSGNIRWSAVMVHTSTAITMTVIAKSAEAFLLHWLPYAGPFAVYGLTAFLVGWGPLAAPKVIDAIVDRIRGGRT